MRMTVSASFFAVAGESPISSKTLLHVLKIARANFFRLGIILGVVIAVGKAKSALPHAHNHGVGVIGVLLRAAVEQQGIAGKMQTSYDRREVMNALEGLHLVERRLHRFRAKFLDSRFIHAGGVIVADLLGNGIG